MLASTALFSSSATSSGARNSRPAKRAGRSRGVMLWLSQIPCRSECPHAVRGAVHAAFFAGAFAVWAAANRAVAVRHTIVANKMARLIMLVFLHTLRKFAPVYSFAISRRKCAGDNVRRSIRGVIYTPDELIRGQIPRDTSSSLNQQRWLASRPVLN